MHDKSAFAATVKYFGEHAKTIITDLFLGLTLLSGLLMIQIYLYSHISSHITFLLSNFTLLDKVKYVVQYSIKAILKHNKLVFAVKGTYFGLF